jgi:fructoselysine-6-P-deglycase FrlB-like protein
VVRAMLPGDLGGSRAAHETDHCGAGRSRSMAAATSCVSVPMGTNATAVSFVRDEIASQPAMWRRAAETARAERARLPANGQRVAIVGCGTSLFMAEAWAAARELAGQGETDAFTPTEAPPRRYDLVVVLTRSGTTTEVLDYVRGLAGATRTVAVTGTPVSPIVELCDETVLLDYADERSVVQTRFATTALALARACLGDDIDSLADAAEGALAESLPFDAEGVKQFVFLGHGMAVGVAREAGLKLREAAGAWTEAYPSTEFRHGPISAIGAASVVWAFSPAPEGTPDAVRATGAAFLQAHRDPMVELIVAQRLAVALAQAKGLDPDHPRHLTRSVILPSDSQGGRRESQ